ncbi:MAG: hypothetical protein JWO94_234, partial [Verrucomicrobiaceae bacterium]|nr:hypothetical protein [Verrucomicrobiaceae bacterium]
MDDDENHGSHCAGIIGAVGNNHLGISGICPVVRIMAVKVIDGDGYVASSDWVAGLNYAVARGVKITSASFGGGLTNRVETSAMANALAAGVLMVTAAGNDYPGVNIDAHPSYPGSYGYANIINVAATGQNDTLATFSDYGAAGVDLAAPGVGILSTVRRGGYAYDSGTSMSCPLVAGACALLKASHPLLSMSELKAAILNGVDPLPALAGKVKTGGRLNVARALRIGAGPYIELTKLTVADGKLLGAKGNSDGIINPGEDITVAIAIKNAGPAAVTGLTTSAVITSGGDAVTVVKGSRTWGTLAAAASISNTTVPFVLHIAANATVPQSFTLHLLHQDNAGHNWTTDSNLTIDGTHALGGQVTYQTGGKPVSKATITYTGPVSGKAVTGADGRYTLKLPDGNYTLGASFAGYAAASTQTISVPPDRSDVNFQMGRGQLVVTPASIAATLTEGQTAHQQLTLRNTGAQPLTVTLSSSQLGVTVTSAAAKRAPWWDRDTPAFGADDATTSTGLPYEHGFETSALTGWSAAKYYGYWFGHYAIETTGAASGSRCLHQWGIGEPSGVAHSLPSGSRPHYVSVWMKPGSTASRLGAVALETTAVDDYGTTYFAPLATVMAFEGGVFHVGDYYHTASTQTHYTANQWYHIEIVNIDWTGRTYDVRIDGNMAAQGVYFDAYPDAPLRIRLYNEEEGDAWWDDVKAGGASEDWLQPQAAPITLDPGATTTADVALNAGALQPGTAQALIHVRSDDPVRPLINIPVTLKVLLNPADTAAAAIDGQVTVIEDVPSLITLPATNAEADPLQATVLTLPPRGTLYQTTDGVTPGNPITTVPAVLSNTASQLFYLAPLNANGQAFTSLQFTVQDWRHPSSVTKTLTINVAAVNDPPVAVDDVFAEAADGSYAALPVLANDTDVDGDTLLVAAVTQGAHGTVTINADGTTLAYQPDPAFIAGSDRFTYTAGDGHGGQGTATVTICRGGNPADEWTTSRHDAQRSNFSLSSAGGMSYVKQWDASVLKTSSYSYAQATEPVVAAGRVIITYYDSGANSGYRVAAFDLATGGLAWRFPDVGCGSVSTPLIHQGKAIFTTVVKHNYGGPSNGAVYAVDVRTGAPVWTLPFPESISSPNPAAVDDEGVHVVLPASPARAVVLNPADGTIIRERNLPVILGGSSTWKVMLSAGLECFHGDGQVISFLPGTSATPYWRYNFN